MKRRDFGKSIFALGLAPAVPANLAFATTTPVVEASVSQYMYGLANFYTRLHGEASVVKLQSYLPLSNQQATQVLSRMLKEGVISAPNAAGIANAVNPFAKQKTAIVNTVIKDGAKQVEDVCDELISKLDDGCEPETELALDDAAQDENEASAVEIEMDFRSEHT